jgi:hypothetical protein
MEGVGLMMDFIAFYILWPIGLIVLMAGVVYGIYMAHWGVWND